jgi:crotonobetainyl-CoA:carnitine CoA-transferase CaiB-like acyl-CoA transferase
MVKPLAGIRILAIEQFGAGPYGSMYLAELGAEVIKVENRVTGGDPARQSGSVTLADRRQRLLSRRLTSLSAALH